MDKQRKPKLLIIGGGLTGLTLAYYLKEINIDVIIVEARERLGGRIFTKKTQSNTLLELGATWFSRHHRSLIALLSELKLKFFEQVIGETAIYEPFSTSPHQIVQLPDNDEPSFRVSGGTSSIIDSLEKVLNSDNIFKNTRVLSIDKLNDGLKVQTDNNSYDVDYVVSTLPPFLFNKTIITSPELPSYFKELCENTHTWMGESIKIGFTYAKPFWRSKDTSRTIFSNVGPITEFYDHASADDQLFALKGFFNGSYYSKTKEERRQMALDQLQKYYGPQVLEYLSYEEKVWKEDELTSGEYENHLFPHQNNGDELFQKPFLDDCLFFGGTETATDFSGYMEGAVLSAKSLFEKLEKQLKRSYIPKSED